MKCIRINTKSRVILLIVLSFLFPFVSNPLHRHIGGYINTSVHRWKEDNIQMRTGWQYPLNMKTLLIIRQLHVLTMRFDRIWSTVFLLIMWPENKEITCRL